MITSFKRFAVVSFALASVVACSSGESSTVSEGLASTVDTPAPEAKATCPTNPLPVLGASCPHKNLSCPTDAFTCMVGTPYYTCIGTEKNLTWGAPSCVANIP